MGLYRALKSSSELRLEGVPTPPASVIGESDGDAAAAAAAMSGGAPVTGPTAARGSTPQQRGGAQQPLHTGAAVAGMSEIVQGQAMPRGSFHARGTTRLGHGGTLAGHGEVDLVGDGDSAGQSGTIIGCGGAEADAQLIRAAPTAWSPEMSGQGADGQWAASSCVPHTSPPASLHSQPLGAALGEVAGSSQQQGGGPMRGLSSQEPSPEQPLAGCSSSGSGSSGADGQQWRSGFVPVEPLYIGFDTFSQMDEVRCPFPSSCRCTPYAVWRLPLMLACVCLVTRSTLRSTLQATACAAVPSRFPSLPPQIGRSSSGLHQTTRSSSWPTATASTTSCAA